MKKFELPAHIISTYDQNVAVCDHSMLHTIADGDFNEMWNTISAYITNEDHVFRIMSGLACIAIVDSVERINQEIDNGEMRQ